MRFWQRRQVLSYKTPVKQLQLCCKLSGFVKNDSGIVSQFLYNTGHYSGFYYRVPEKLFNKA